MNRQPRPDSIAAHEADPSAGMERERRRQLARERKRLLDRERQRKKRRLDRERQQEQEGVHSVVRIKLYVDAVDALVRRGELVGDELDNHRRLTCAIEDLVNSWALTGVGDTQRDMRDNGED